MRHRLDMAKVQVRNKVTAITDNAALEALFESDRVRKDTINETG